MLFSDVIADYLKFSVARDNKYFLCLRVVVGEETSALSQFDDF